LLSQPLRTPASEPLAAAEPARTANELAPKAESPLAIRVQEEAHLLRQADAELARGDARHARELLDEYARLFPSGVLSEESDAEQVLVLCAEGEAGAAHTAAAMFLRSHPNSPLASRVRGSCAGR